MFLCASPAYLARAGTPGSLADLERLGVLGYRYSAGGDTLTLEGPNGTETLRVTERLRANNGDLLREAAIAGMGITLQPDFIVGQALDEGRLVQVLPEYRVLPLRIFAVYASRSHLAPKVRSFIDFLVEFFAIGCPHPLVEVAAPPARWWRSSCCARPPRPCASRWSNRAPCSAAAPRTRPSDRSTCSTCAPAA